MYIVRSCYIGDSGFVPERLPVALYGGTLYKDTLEVKDTPLVRTACAVPNIRIVYIFTTETRTLSTPEIRALLSSGQLLLSQPLGLCTI